MGSEWMTVWHRLLLKQSVPLPWALVAQGSAIVFSLFPHEIMEADGDWPPFLPELQKSCVMARIPESTTLIFKLGSAGRGLLRRCWGSRGGRLGTHHSVTWSALFTQSCGLV